MNYKYYYNTCPTAAQFGPLEIKVIEQTWKGRGPSGFLISTLGRVIFFGGGIDMSIK